MASEKERIRRCIHFQATDKIPWQINCTTTLADRLVRTLGLEDKGADDPSRYVALDDYFGNHIAYARNRGIHSLRELRAGIWRDEWGVEWDRTVDKDIGTPVNRVLDSGRISSLAVPDPDDPDRYAHIRPIIDANPHRYILAKFSYSLFERAWSLRGLEALLVDFLENPTAVHDLMRSICDFNLRIMRNLRQYGIDGIYFGDDWGSQRGLLMSPSTWRELIKPYLKEMYAQAHAQGYDVFIHCCGRIDAILDDLIEIGVNVFNPFQPEVMDVESLLKRYSGKLAFYGSLSIQKTLPFGTPQDVVDEVRRRITAARAFGGLIVAPSHDMPPDIPLENVAAMRDVLRGQ